MRNMSELGLEKLRRCFEGIIPSILSTCSADGIPNVTYVSQVHLIDDRHVALSHQFLNKTRRNLTENPYACLQFSDPLTFESYRIHVRYDHEETSGPLFESMAARIDAIASHTGMTGIFKLLAADVCEVLSIEPVEGFLLPPTDADLPVDAGRLSMASMNEIRALQVISDRLNRARDMDQIFTTALSAFDELLGLTHAMVLVPDETGERLVTLASRGYGESGIGAEVPLGQGIIGTAAATRRLVRVTGLGWELRYARAVRERAQSAGALSVRAEIPLPGLPAAQSQLALPMLVGEELVGVLLFESTDGRAFRAWHEAFLQVLANQIAIAVDGLRKEDDEAPLSPSLRPSEPRAEPAALPAASSELRPLRFQFFKNDDCVFVDGEYLVRNVPGKILWKILTEYASSQRTQFTNRELRLDPTLGLPPLKDNLESRLILLRKRLAEKCPDVRLVPTQRGRFALELSRPLELVEREHA